MEIQTLGHASLLISDDAGEPVLLTDPWLIGSCYWRSWWLQNYPDKDLVRNLMRVRYCYITHEHPDHFHTASIRKLSRNIQFLSPSLPQERIAKYLSSQGFRANTIPRFEWKEIHPKINILSIPLFNDDSLLLIDTPQACIINLNDSKPRVVQMKRLSRFLGENAPAKKRILLSSYSPASIVNSFIRNAERISIKSKEEYVRYISENCELMKIDYYMPFASQVIFKRSDSAWANEFKVSYRDLSHYWSAKDAVLLPPYAKMNLDSFERSFTAEERYNHNEEEYIPKILHQEDSDAAADFDDVCIDKLRQKLNHHRLFLCLLFPKGIGFNLEKKQLYYNPWSGDINETAAKGNFILKIPAGAFRDAIMFGHFGDLGITMFTTIILNSNIHPRRIYLLFVIVTYHDYGHTAKLTNFFKWLRNSIRVQKWSIPRPPALTSVQQ
ncbi:MAG: MBL fold metallo-hydrolase [Nitrososphaera sp.]|nr:MBL fold metallo-hydrolase [Nitrososphaera sp.]